MAAGNLSVVIGSHGKALHKSSAVLAFNASGDTPCASQGDGTVNICASGGLYVNGDHFTSTITTLNDTVAINEAAISQLQSGDVVLWANASAQQLALQDHGRKFEDMQATLLEVKMNATMLFDWLTVQSTGLEALGTNASLQWSLITGLEREDLRLWQASQSHDVGLAALNETTTNHEFDIDVLTHAVGRHDVAIASLNLTATEQQSAIDNLTATMETGLRSDSMSIAGLQEASQNHSDAIDLLHMDVLENSLNIESLNTSAIGLVENASAQQLVLSAHSASIGTVQNRISEHDDDLFHLVDENAILWANASSQQKRLDELETWIAAVNDSDLEQQLDIDGQWVALDYVKDVVAELDATTHLQRGIIGQLNSTNFQQKFEIAELKTQMFVANDTISAHQIEIRQLKGTIADMNDTNSAQQFDIDELRYALDSMNDTLVSLKSAIDHVTSVSSFAPVAEVSPSTVAGTTSMTDCIGDNGSPCSTAGPPTSIAPDIVTGPSVTLDACYVYPCQTESGTVPVDTLAWDREVVVVANTDAADFVDDSASFDFEFSLQSGGDLLWRTVSDNPFASFVPSDLEVTSVDNYTLKVSVIFSDGQTISHSIRGVMFAAPPLLHGVHTAWVNGSAAVSWFEVVVNATDLTELSYTYRVVDADDGWAVSVDSDASEAVTIGVPSTRPFLLEVTVTNAFGSSATCSECPLLMSVTSNFSDAEIWHDVFDQLNALSIGSSVLLSGIDVFVGGFGEYETLLDAFLDLLASNSTAVSHDVAVVYEFLQAGVADGALDAIESIALRLDAATQGVFAKAVDLYGVVVAAEPDPMDGLAELDAFLTSVCVANEAGDVPDGETTMFEEHSYSLSCASTEALVSVHTDAATFVVAVDGLSTAAVSTWKSAANWTNGTASLSDVFGVHVLGDGFDGDAVDVDDTRTLKLELHGERGELDAVRKAMSCKYYDETHGVWSVRGVVLRGLELDAGFGDSGDSGDSDGFGVRAICASSHLTLFSIGDESEAARIVENKILSFAGRVEGMNRVDLLSDATGVNWWVLGVFVGITACFVVVGVVAKVRGRKTAVDRGRSVFQQDGQLSKPNTMGSREFEAVLRKWISGCAAAKLMLLEVLTSNSVLGLLFHWDHEAVVFGRADKAVVLFGAILMTFVSSAFLFDPNESVSPDPVVQLWSALVAAALANVLLLPVQHFLPFMVSNVNSLTTFSPMPLPLLKRELRRRSCWKPRERQKSTVEIQSRVLLHWVGLTWDCGRGQEQQRRLRHPPPSHERIHVATKLHFANCEVKVPSAVVVDHGSMDLSRIDDGVVGGVVRFQQLLRSTLAWKQHTRRVEFDAWYKDLRHHRHVLARLSAVVLLVLAMFTLAICLLLSGTFDDDETVLWVVDVAQSLVVQIFVTDPAVTLLLIFLKLLISWMLYKSGKKRLKQQLKCKDETLEKRRMTVRAKVDVVSARMHALQVMRSGNDAAIAREKSTQDTAKKRCELVLEGIAAKKATILQERQIAKPRKIELEAWDAQHAELDNKENETRAALQSIEAALAVLCGGDEVLEEAWSEAQVTLVKLRKQLGKIEQAKCTIRLQREKIEEHALGNQRHKRHAQNTIVPIAHATQRQGPKKSAADEENSVTVGTTLVPATRAATRSAINTDCDEEEEPDVERAFMPSVRTQARRSLPRTDAHATSAMTHEHTVPIVRRGSRRRRRQRNESDKNVELNRKHTVVAKLKTPQPPGGGQVSGGASACASKPIAKQSGKRSAMTWADIRALQDSLKAKAAKQPARRGRTRVISTATLSPRAIKAILARRRRRARLLEQRAREAL